MNQELLNYIAEQLKNGVGKEEISKTLMAGGGWAYTDINTAFTMLSSGSANSANATGGNKLSAPISKNIINALYCAFVVLAVVFSVFPFVVLLTFPTGEVPLRDFFEYAPYLFFIGMLLGLIVLNTTDAYAPFVKFSKSKIALGLIYGATYSFIVFFGLMTGLRSAGMDIISVIALVVMFVHLNLLFKFSYLWNKGKRISFTIFSFIMDSLIALIIWFLVNMRLYFHGS